MMNNMKAFVKKNFLSLVLSIGTILYGFELSIMTVSFDYLSFYNRIQPYLDSTHIGVILIAAGLLKLVAIIIDNFKLRRLSITLLIFIWFFVATFALLSEPRNIIYVYSFTIALFAFGTTFKDEGSL